MCAHTYGTPIDGCHTEVMVASVCAIEYARCQSKLHYVDHIRS